MENEGNKTSGRLLSLDALRGFDMFWIMGGEHIFIALATLTGWPILEWWADQLQHGQWHGFHFYDMIFPLFLFIAGISFPFSMAKRYEGAENRKALYKHVIYRGLILVLLGIIYNNAIQFDFANMRYGSVLGRIGLAWMFAALIFMNTDLRGRITAFAGILLGYWLLMRFTHAPDLGDTDPFSMQGNLSGYIDRLILPGKFCCYEYGDSEGILTTIPAISTALLGMLTGQFIRSAYLQELPYRKIAYMIGAGVLLIVLGQLWNLAFPINKYLWSSSFVCYVGGMSLVLFSLFYLVIDIWKFQKWTFFFRVIGMNSITIYLAGSVFDFEHTAKFLFGGLIDLFPDGWASFLGATAYVATGWLFLYLLWKKKIFLKV